MTFIEWHSLKRKKKKEYKKNRQIRVKWNKWINEWSWGKDKEKSVRDVWMRLEYWKKSGRKMASWKEIWKYELRKENTNKYRKKERKKEMNK